MILSEIGSLVFFMLITFTALQAQQDPCASVIDKNITVDMCKTGNVTESYKTGGTNVNSVILRITEQKDNCRCQVRLMNQTSIYTVYMRKHNELKSAAPVTDSCGLAIDIEYTIIADDNGNSPIQCTSGTSLRSMNLVQNGVLEFKSRIINGNLTRGYCMQIFRDHYAEEFPILRLNCSSIPTTTIKPTQILTTSPSILSSTINSTSTSTTTQANVKNSTVYYIAGACGGGGLVIIISIVIVIFCKRRNNTSRTKQPYTNPEANHQYDGNEYVYDGLKDNILYVSSDQNPNSNGSNTDSNYKEVDPNGRHPNHHLELEDLTYSSIDNDGNTGKVRPAIEGKSITADSNMMFGFEDGRQSQSRTPYDTNSEYAVVNKTNKKRPGSKTE